MHNIIQMETSAKTLFFAFRQRKDLYLFALLFVAGKHRLAATLPSGPSRRSDVASHLFLLH